MRNKDINIEQKITDAHRSRSLRLLKFTEEPSLILKMTDREIHDAMIIENMHRENLSKIEEAQSIMHYIRLFNKKVSVSIIAEKLSLSKEYIRKRIRYLSLPYELVCLWSLNKIDVRHLDFIIRMSPKIQKECALWIKAKLKEKDHLFPNNLKNWIINRHIDLVSAKFNTEECLVCPYNSTIQRVILELDRHLIAYCMNPPCFATKQKEYLKKNSEFMNNLKIHDLKIIDLEISAFTAFTKSLVFKTDKTLLVCHKCPDCVGVISFNGEFAKECYKKVCNGIDACFDILKIFEATE